LPQAAKEIIQNHHHPAFARSNGQIEKVIRGLYLRLTDNQLLDLIEPQAVVHVLKDRQETLWIKVEAVA
jgi:hypothetical protein